nr:GNAT family N-acetyltransferase [uncultured Cohaesibacter sp.]
MTSISPSPDSPSTSASSTLTFRPIRPDDAVAILQIYQEGIDTGNATFTAQAPDWIGWDNGHLQNCRIAALLSGEIVGWAALSAYSSRDVYRGVAELSIYIASHAKGQRVGSQLMGRLVEASEQEGFWTLQAGIFTDNAASIRLHEKFGFRCVGVREKIAKMSNGPQKGRWRDVALYERRSSTIGQ